MLKKLIAPVVLGGALLGSLAVGGSAYAAAPTTTPSAAHTTAGKGEVRSWLRAHRKELRRGGVAVSAKAIGITPKVLVADLKSGESIAQVATANHVDPSTVVQALTTAADARVNQAVKAGKLTSAQGTKIEAKVPALMTRAVDKVR